MPPSSDVARAFIASRNVFRFTDRWSEIDALGSTISLDTQIDLFLDVRRMSERGTTWLLRHFPPPMHIDTAIATFGQASTCSPSRSRRTWAGESPTTSSGSADNASTRACPPTSPRESARWPWLHTGFDIVHVAFSENCDVDVAAVTYWAVFEAFDIGWLWDGIGGAAAFGPVADPGPFVDARRPDERDGRADRAA